MGINIFKILFGEVYRQIYVWKFVLHGSARGRYIVDICLEINFYGFARAEL